jgi:hypothetical protein
VPCTALRAGWGRGVEGKWPESQDVSPDKAILRPFSPPRPLRSLPEWGALCKALYLGDGTKKARLRATSASSVNVRNLPLPSMRTECNNVTYRSHRVLNSSPFALTTRQRRKSYHGGIIIETSMVLLLVWLVGRTLEEYKFTQVKPDWYCILSGTPCISPSSGICQKTSIGPFPSVLTPDLTYVLYSVP